MYLDNLSKTKLSKLNKIIECSYDIINIKGIKNFTMDDIAINCSLNRRTVYNYFDSRKTLLSYLKDLSEDEILKSLNFDIIKTKCASENLKYLIHKYSKSYIKNREHHKFLFQIRYENIINNNFEIKISDNDYYVNNSINLFKEVIEYGKNKSELKVNVNSDKYAKLIFLTLTGYLDRLIISKKISNQIYFDEIKIIEKFILDFVASITIIV